MEVFSHLAVGFQTAGTLENLMYCFIGVFLGTAIGVLPGIGPLATIAMLLPITYQSPRSSPAPWRPSCSRHLRRPWRR